MTDDPGISNTNSSTRNLDRNKQTNKPKKPWWLEPRWAGGRPHIEPGGRRAVAIQEKRVWEKVKALLAQCADGARAVDAFVAGELVDLEPSWAELAPAVPLAAALELRDVHKRMLIRIAAVMRRFDALGVIASHEQLAELVMRSQRQTRRVMADLSRYELVSALPNHEKRGAVHSRVANGYALSPALIAVVKRPPGHRDSNRNGQASGTGSVLRTSADAISPTLPEIGLAPPSAPPLSPSAPVENLIPERPGHAGPGIVEPDFPEPRLCADESSVVACPETQDATRGVSGSIERAGVGDGARAYAAMLAILDGGAG